MTPFPWILRKKVVTSIGRLHRWRGSGEECGSCGRTGDRTRADRGIFWCERTGVDNGDNIGILDGGEDSNDEDPVWR